MSRSALLPAALVFVTGCGGCGGGAAANDAASAPDAGATSEGGVDAQVERDGHTDGAGDATVDVAPPMGKPEWDDLPFQVVGCTVQRLINASDLALFNWGACPSIPNCAQAIFDPYLVSSTAGLTPRTRVADDGATTRLVVTVYDESTSDFNVYLSDENGHVLAGYRTQNSAATTCTLGGSVGATRFVGNASSGANQGGVWRMGGLLGPWDGSSQVVPFEISPVPPGIPDELVVGDSRLLRRWSPDQLGTLSNIDGSGFTIFAKLSASIRSLDWVSTTGPSFLFDVIELTDGGAERYIARSDGLAAPEPFITGSPDIWVGASGCANSFLVWQRGINPHDVNKFDAIELWASPYTEDSAKLAPFKVDDLGGQSLFPGAAGWGRYALAVPELPTQHTTIVWDLATKTRREIVLPPDRYIGSWPGLTRTHLWLLAHETTSTQTPLLRFTLSP